MNYINKLIKLTILLLILITVNESPVDTNSYSSTTDRLITKTNDLKTFTSHTTFFVERNKGDFNNVIDFYCEVGELGNKFAMKVKPFNWYILENRKTPKKGLIIELYSPTNEKIDVFSITYGDLNEITFNLEVSTTGLWRIHFEEDFVNEESWDADDACEGVSFYCYFYCFDSVYYRPVYFDRENQELEYRIFRSRGLHSYPVFFKASEITNGQSELYFKYIGDWNGVSSPIEKIEIYYPHGGLAYTIDTAFSVNAEVKLNLPIFQNDFYKIIIYEKEEINYNYYFAIFNDIQSKTIPFYLSSNTNKPPSTTNTYELLIDYEFSTTSLDSWDMSSWGSVSNKNVAFSSSERIGTSGYSIHQRSKVLSDPGGFRMVTTLGINLNSAKDLFFSMMFKSSNGETVFRLVIKDDLERFVFLDFFRSNRYEFNIYDGGKNVIICDYPTGKIIRNEWLAYYFNINSVLDELTELESWKYDDFQPIWVDNIEIYQDQSSYDENNIYYDNIYVGLENIEVVEETNSLKTDSSTSTNSDDYTSLKNDSSTQDTILSLLPQIASSTPGFIWSVINTLIIVVLIKRGLGSKLSSKTKKI